MSRRLFALMLAAGFAFAQAQQSLILGISPVQTQGAQPTAQQSEARTKINVSSDLVVITVTVKDRYVNLVPALLTEEIRIFDYNVEQSIDIFTSEATPLSLVVLL